MRYQDVEIHIICAWKQCLMIVAIDTHFVFHISIMFYVISIL